MSDCDERHRRDARADRYGSAAAAGDGAGGGGGGGGRYNRARFRRDEDRDPHSSSGSPDHGDPFARAPRGRGAGRFEDASDDDAHDRRDSRRRVRLEGGNGGDGGAPWQQQQQQFQPFMQPGMGFPFPDPMMMGMMGGAQPGHPGFANMPGGGGMPLGYDGMGGMNSNMGNSNNGGGGGMTSDALLQFLLQQQQQQAPPSMMPGSYFNAPMPSSSSGMPQAPAAQQQATGRVLPSVEEFVPVVPKSLMNLVIGDRDAANGGGYGGSAPSGPAGGGGGALVLLEAPKIGPDADRRAREQRRAHLSGFPNGTTREELEDYLRLLLPEVRRLQTEREIRELAEATGLIKDEGEEAVRHVPANANLSTIDEVKSVTVNANRYKSFSFIEVRLADMIDELVSQSAADPNRFLFTSSLDGQTYPLLVRRPRDTDPLTGKDESKVVLIGFPPSMSEEVIKPVYESYGKLLKFEVKNGYAYGEFAELRDATDFRADMHGVVLGSNMVVALPLYDWLKALLVREEIDVTVEDDDPMSGKYVMKQVQEQRAGGGYSILGAPPGGVFGGGGDAGGAGVGGNSTALVVAAEDPEAASLQLMRGLLDMTFTLPDTLGRFAGLYPHLRPLFGNTQLTVYATPLLVLLNLFDEKELELDATYSRLLADIEEEVERHGRVKRLIVPRREAPPRAPPAPKPGIDYDEDDADAKAAAADAYATAKKQFTTELGTYMSRQTHPVWGGYGRVFVEYETVDEAAEAQQAIAGKLFGERTVVTSFLFPDLLVEKPEAAAEETGAAGAEAAFTEATEAEEAAEAPAGDATAVNEDDAGNGSSLSESQPQDQQQPDGDGDNEVGETTAETVGNTEDID